MGIAQEFQNSKSSACATIQVAEHFRIVSHHLWSYLANYMQALWAGGELILYTTILWMASKEEIQPPSLKTCNHRMNNLKHKGTWKRERHGCWQFWFSDEWKEGNLKQYLKANDNNKSTHKIKTYTTQELLTGIIFQANKLIA